MGDGAAVSCLTARSREALAVQGFRSARREEIARGLAAGRSYQEIATALDRAASTVSREVAANVARLGSRSPSRSAVSVQPRDEDVDFLPFDPSSR
jgi:IS30 family transposase